MVKNERMEFEIEIEMTKNFTSSFITEIQGCAEETRIKATLDDLSSLIKCLEEGAKKFGCSVQDLLKRTKSVKLRAPEVVADTLTNKAGPRERLVVSKGREENAYFRGISKIPVLESIVAKETVIGMVWSRSNVPRHFKLISALPSMAYVMSETSAQSFAERRNGRT